MTLAVLLGAGVITGLVNAPAASAAAPNSTTWVYVDTTSTSTIQSIGTRQGTADKASGGYHIIVLHFGSQIYDSTNGYRVRTSFGPIMTRAQVDAIGIAYATGWYNAMGTSPGVLTLALGSNNDGSFAAGTTDPTSAYQYGRAWSNNVTATANGLTSAIRSKVSLQGAFDNEIGFGSASNTLNQLNGFFSINTNYMYDYGDAAGCPASGTANCVTPSDRNDGTNNTWTVDQRYQMAWGLTRSQSIPQIYNGTMGGQWGNLDRYGSHYRSAPIYFQGSLSQYLVCTQQGFPASCSGTSYTPTQSWTSLQNQMNAESGTAANLPGSYNIGIESSI